MQLGNKPRVLTNFSSDFSSDFSLTRPGYAIKRLTRQDADLLQRLYEQCADFCILTTGVPASPTAGRDEFDDVPDGKTAEDVFIFGLLGAGDDLLGAIAAIQHYPDRQTGWIGLMMLAPEQRGRGLGAAFYRAFERWVSGQGIARIGLVAIAANKPGLRFWKRMGFETVRKMPPRQYNTKTHEVYVLSRTVDKAS